MSRKDGKAERGRTSGDPGRAPGPTSVLPMDVRVGDRFTEEGFEWEVLTRPAHLRGGKAVRARVVRPGVPETEREVTWPAHQRIEIRRGTA